jgi:hypothetical protein
MKILPPSPLQKISSDQLSLSQNKPSPIDTNERSTIFDFDEFQANLDKYRKFKTKMFTVTGSKWGQLSKLRHVCLGAQTSIDRLYWLLETVKTWSGPISIALFVPDVEFHISKVYINYIRRCFPRVKEQVSSNMFFIYLCLSH